MYIPSFLHSPHRKLPADDARPLSTTPSFETDIVPGRRLGERVFENMDQVAEATLALDYHPIDPFVASVASTVNARRVDDPDEDMVEFVQLEAEAHFEGAVTAELGLHNGPGAPMLVIMPGVYGPKDGNISTHFKKIALESGMNYAIMSNPLNPEHLEDSEPVRHPGNIRVEAEATHALLTVLRDKKPEYFRKTSLAGYSYGGLLAANVARIDEEKNSDRIVQGGVLALSPPQNLSRSMGQLDSLRELYAEGSGSVTATTFLYTREVAEHGYENFMDSKLAKRGQGTNITEVEIADKYGSRDAMKEMVEWVDEHFSHEQLPPAWPHYFERRETINEMTYSQYSKEWFSKDPWFEETGMSSKEVSTKYSYSQALGALNDTPVLTLVSSDDYILSPEDVNIFGKVDEPDDSEFTRLFDRGGHVGLLFNPQVQNLIGDFCYSAKNLRPSG